ncbi:MAG: isoleucine--tRNA ligase, partial [Acidobacteria bacterium]
VTADELWRHLPGAREASVHLALFPEAPDGLVDAGVVDRWGRLLSVREAVNVEIEKLRQAKEVGQPLEARVELRASGGLLDLLERHRADLPTLFIVSEVDLAAAGERPDALTAVHRGGDDSWVAITVARSGGTRCDRCWRYVPSVTAGTESAGLCDRCLDALAEARS